MKIFISGKITGLPREEVVEKFAKAQAELEALGHTVLNPTILPPEGFEHSDYIHICKAMIDVCEVIVYLPDWPDSKGARMEYEYAERTGKKMYSINADMIIDRIEKEPVSEEIAKEAWNRRVEE